jgi:hypothetical protein
MFEARVKVIPHKFQPDENQTGSQYHFQLRLRCGKIPGYSFSASLQNYKDDENPGPALVTHHFAGSWKNEIGGEVADPVP